MISIREQNVPKGRKIQPTGSVDDQFPGELSSPSAKNRRSGRGGRVSPFPSPSDFSLFIRVYVDLFSQALSAVTLYSVFRTSKLLC